MYRRLEVPPEASADQIRGAYRRMAHALHPDANPGDPDAARRFREITEAYEILGSAERRARYDSARRQTAPAVSWPTSSAPRPVASGGTSSGHRGSEADPTVTGTGRFPRSWPPLTAGPVRVAPRAAALGEQGGPSDEFSRWVEAVLSWLRS